MTRENRIKHGNLHMQVRTNEHSMFPPELKAKREKVEKTTAYMYSTDHTIGN